MNENESQNTPDDGLDSGMTPEEQAHDLGLAGRTLEEVELDREIEELRARNPGAFEFVKMFVEASQEYRDEQGRSRPAPPASESRSVHTPAPASANESRTARLDREIDEIKRHPAYFKQHHPEHKAVQEQAARLYAERYDKEN